MVDYYEILANKPEALREIILKHIKQLKKYIDKPKSMKSMNEAFAEGYDAAMRFIVQDLESILAGEKTQLDEIFNPSYEVVEIDFYEVVDNE